jgi:hypothetical protein
MFTNSIVDSPRYEALKGNQHLPSSSAVTLLIIHVLPIPGAVAEQPMLNHPAHPATVLRHPIKRGARHSARPAM